MIITAIVCLSFSLLIGLSVGALCHRWAAGIMKPSRNVVIKLSNMPEHEHSNSDTPAAAGPTPAPYEEVVWSHDPSAPPPGRRIELKENVAYAPAFTL